MELVQLAAQMVGSLKSEEMRTKVLEGVFERLRDPDEKVRIAACKAACAVASAHPALVADSAAAAGGGPIHLEEVSVRMRDLRPAVRRAAVVGLMALFRGRVSKGGLAGGKGVYWIPARAIMCACADAPLRQELETAVWRDGLLGPSAAPGLVAQVWVEVWRQAAPHEVSKVVVLLEAKALLQFEALSFLECRRLLAGTEGDQRAGLQAKMDAAARKLAKRLPDPFKAEQQLAALRDVRDNRVAASLLAALALGAKSEAAARARSDALQRVNSKSPLADFLRLLLAYAQPSLLPQEAAGALLDLAAGVVPKSGHAAGRIGRGGDVEGRDDAEGEEDEEKEGSGGSGEDVEDEEGAGARGGKRRRRGAGARAGARKQRKVEATGGAQEGDGEGSAVAPEVAEAARAVCRQVSKSAGGLFAGQTERLSAMLAGGARDGGGDKGSGEEEEGAARGELRALAAQLLSRWARVAAGLSPSCAAAGAASAQPAAGSGAGERPLRQGRGAAAAAAEGAPLAEGGAALEPLRAALLRVASEGPPKAARHAVAALHFLYGAAIHQELGSLCGRLARGLTPKRAGDALALAHVHALSAIGQYIPDALAPHSEALSEFVTNRLLGAYISHPGNGGGGGAELSVAEPGFEVAAKCGAIRALARALTPEIDGDEVRVETIRATCAFIDELQRLLDVEAPPEWLPAHAAPEQEGAVRLAAARAVLRLVRRHDVRLPQPAYCLAALTMQDPVVDVRRLFAAKLAAAIHYFNVRPRYHQLSAKLAAMMALGAADPVPQHKRAAAGALRDWARARRAAAQRLITAAAADRAADGGSTMQEQPEMAVPYLIHLLAHHPDMPVVRSNTRCPLREPILPQSGQPSASLRE
ncbi:hypothetical protein MNEG_6868 [Monoraphidium neglectum]|uniref:Uncharacterized protein n=1 Tax=Monoraphidium neglectum TaxID=145388 RepID=A0A0D2MD25_9CHLO|nr:hypothetical protein MNEG_6868 [Monoraphidium neglectum]KIZ01095.1 hypothetical protein MNEG_6868 [Monoraphidium neglectum]|eukprot:XP_013900114.1 hypothetical protein MNEG_6868 [Monoraphidium neglectum]